MWLLGALALVLLGVMIGGPLKRRLTLLQRGDWRPGAGVLAIAAIAAGLFMIVRAAVLPGAVLLAAGVGALIAARRRAQAKAAPKPFSDMDRAEAASILGVSERASAAEVQGAYLRLMRRAHPDAGGSTGPASQLNRARAVMMARAFSDEVDTGSS